LPFQSGGQQLVAQMPPFQAVGINEIFTRRRFRLFGQFQAQSGGEEALGLVENVAQLGERREPTGFSGKAL
jgi:hypothetical protein